MASLLVHVARLAASNTLAALDVALAEALLDLHAPARVALYSPVGEPADLRWFTRLQGPPVALAEALWADAAMLPPLNAEPTRLQCLSRCEPVHLAPGADGLYQILLPLRSEQQTVAVVVLAGPALAAEAVQQDFERLQRAWRHRHAALDAGNRDPLTGLPNRQAFESVLAIAIQGGDAPSDPPAAPVPAAPAVERRHAPRGHYWLGLVNIDGFAQINTRLGHLAGDAVLARTGQRLVRLLRYYDRVFRLAGSEFVVLLRCPDGGAASSALERVRMALAGTLPAGSEPLALCIGFTALRPDDSPGAALERADRALFAAKAGDGPRVRSDAGLPEAPTGPAEPAPSGLGLAPGGGWLQ